MSPFGFSRLRDRRAWSLLPWQEPLARSALPVSEQGAANRLFRSEGTARLSNEDPVFCGVAVVIWHGNNAGSIASRLPLLVFLHRYSIRRRAHTCSFAIRLYDVVLRSTCGLLPVDDRTVLPVCLIGFKLSKIGSNSQHRVDGDGSYLQAPPDYCAINYAYVVICTVFDLASI